MLPGRIEAVLPSCCTPSIDPCRREAWPSNWSVESDGHCVTAHFPAPREAPLLGGAVIDRERSGTSARRTRMARPPSRQKLRWRGAARMRCAPPSSFRQPVAEFQAAAGLWNPAVTMGNLPRRLPRMAIFAIHFVGTCRAAGLRRPAWGVGY